MLIWRGFTNFTDTSCPKHDIKIVLGDFNAKVDKEGNNYPHAGRNGLHECNGNGNKLVQFAAATDMIIGGTIFAHKNIHKVTGGHRMESQ